MEKDLRIQLGVASTLTWVGVRRTSPNGEIEDDLYSTIHDVYLSNCLKLVFSQHMDEWDEYRFSIMRLPEHDFSSYHRYIGTVTWIKDGEIKQVITKDMQLHLG